MDTKKLSRYSMGIPITDLGCYIYFHYFRSFLKYIIVQATQIATHPFFAVSVPDRGSGSSLNVVAFVSN